MDRSRPLRRRLLTVTLAATLWTSTLALTTGVIAVPLVADAKDTGSTPAAVLAAPSDAHIRLRLIASGLSKPVFATTANDGSGRIFIVEKTGKIKILKNGVVRSTPFLNISSEVSKGSEQGLLGLAFHPQFKSNRKLYVNFTNLAGDTVIREYRASTSNPNVVSTSTKRRILKIAQPFANHNGGMLAFGPDGYLYIGMGDGGGAGDPGNRAQNPSVLLGKMLRIDINRTTSTTAYVNPATNPYVGIAGRDELWQIGLRNPWRFSFDKITGDLWIGDVGQGRYEEVDRAIRTSAGAGRGVNWGWRVLEGTHCYSPPSGCNTAGKTMPLLDYDHGNGRCAVTGGYVYRGSAIPLLRGGYVFGDYCSGEIWVVAYNASSPVSKVRLLDTNLLISSFGQIGGGELVVVDLNGRVYRLERA
jgi:glucose/arabinose dehydrogenase